MLPSEHLLELDIQWLKKGSNLYLEKKSLVIFITLVSNWGIGGVDHVDIVGEWFNPRPTIHDQQGVLRHGGDQPQECHRDRLVSPHVSEAKA